MIIWLIDVFRCLKHGHDFGRYFGSDGVYHICRRCGHVEAYQIY